VRYASREGRAQARRLRWVAFTVLVAGLLWTEMHVGDMAMAGGLGLCALAFVVGFTMGME
jgi:hypothetical protein